jgi:hypothetical protein
MPRQRREAQPGAHTAGFIENAVIQLHTSGEAAIMMRRSCSCLRHCIDVSGTSIPGTRGEMTRIETEIVQSAHAEKRRIGAVEIFAAEFAVVLLEEGEDGGAVADGGVADAGDAELAGWAEAAEVEGFEGGVGEEEAAVDQCVCCARISLIPG